MRTIIAGGTLYDGTGSEPVRADIAIENGRIDVIGANLPRNDTAVIDAGGLAVAPGFIDFHSHADFTLPAFPGAINSLGQGVTTEVLGNCGASPAPLPPYGRVRENMQRLNHMLGPELDWSWTSFAEYLDVLDAARPSVNCVPLVGHAAVRSCAMGLDDRAPTPAELTDMERLTTTAMAEGAWGLSTGLIYPPSSYAAPSEIRALAGVVAGNGGLYATHMRDEGRRLADSVEETIAVAEATGVRVQISHLKSSGVASHGRIGEALQRIERARNDGLPVGHDGYPYPASSTTLTQLLPAWALEGGVDAIVARLGSPEVRARIRREMHEDPDSFRNEARDWGDVMIGSVGDAALVACQGRRVDALAGEAGKDPEEFIFDLIVADRAATAMVMFTMRDDDVAACIDHEAWVAGSDQFGVTGPDAQVHPRAYGTFARMLARGAAGEDTALAAVIRRMTSVPAARLGLADRGRVAPGFVADLVLFDPARVRDRATFAAPTRSAEGIERVLIAGETAMSGGGQVDVGLGRVLRRRVR